MATKEKSEKENRGGVRVPGPGKKLGAPKQLKNGTTVKLYLDDATLAALAKIHPNRSKAVRILAGTDKP